MLRQASNLCRAVLLSPDHQIAAAANTSNIQINWAACSVLKAFTANIQGIAVVQQQQQQRQAATAAEARTAPGDDGSSSSSGIVIHDSAVQVSSRDCWSVHSPVMPACHRTPLRTLMQPAWGCCV